MSAWKAIIARAPGMSGEVELSLDEVAELASVPGRRVARATVEQWIRRGRRGADGSMVRLARLRRGNGIAVAMGALAAFLAAIAGADAGWTAGASGGGRVARQARQARRSPRPGGIAWCRPEEVGTYPPGPGMDGRNGLHQPGARRPARQG